MLHILSCLLEGMMSQCMSIKKIESITYYLYSILLVFLLSCVCLLYALIQKDLSEGSNCDNAFLKRGERIQIPKASHNRPASKTPF